MSEIEFLSGNELYVKVPTQVLDNIFSICDLAGKRETGGVLIGQYSDDGVTAHISEATPPPQKSRRFFSRFSRSSSGLKEYLDMQWEKGLYYIGDWHYHPFSSPAPSFQDLSQMQKFADDDGLKCPEPILLIVGGSKEKWTMSIYIVSQRAILPLRLKQEVI